jgi:hypothetical protein
MRACQGAVDPVIKNSAHPSIAINERVNFLELLVELERSKPLLIQQEILHLSGNILPSNGLRITKERNGHPTVSIRVPEINKGSDLNDQTFGDRLILLVRINGVMKGTPHVINFHSTGILNGTLLTTEVYHLMNVVLLVTEFEIIKFTVDQILDDTH